MEIDTIVEMGEKFINLCEASNVNYTSSIITNGYLLSPEVMERLISVKVGNIQITLDGLKEAHDCRRFLVGGKPTFDTIIENIKKLRPLFKAKKTFFPSIGIRMNLDKSNCLGMEELMDYLYKSPIHEYTTFYIAGVFDINDVNNDYTFTQAEYLEYNEKYLNLLKKLDQKEYYEDYYPKMISSFCGCDVISSFVIDSDGTLYKCWEEIGHVDTSIGNIKEIFSANLVNNPWYYSNILLDPTLDDKCSKCKILPNCMGGGCPHRVNYLKSKVDCEAKMSEHRCNIIKSYEILKRNK